LRWSGVRTGSSSDRVTLRQCTRSLPLPVLTSAAQQAFIPVKTDSSRLFRATDTISSPWTRTRRGGFSSDEKENIFPASGGRHRTLNVVCHRRRPGNQIQLHAGNRFLEVQDLQVGEDPERSISEPDSR